MKKYLLLFLAMCFIFFTACNKSNKSYSFNYEKNIERIMKSANLFETKINKDEIGLAHFFAQNLSQIKKIDNNVLIFEDSSVLTFISDGKCNNKSSCKILINTPQNKNELTEIPIQFDKQGKFVINSTDPLTEKPINNKKELRRENTDKEKDYKIYNKKYKLNQNTQQKT